MKTADKAGKNGTGARVLSTTDTRGLKGVPFLGPVRARALCESGIRTWDDLRAATPEQIGGVKGVGMGNAARIKEWLALQADFDPEMPPAPPSNAELSDEIQAEGNQTAMQNQTIQDALILLNAAVTQIQADNSRKKTDPKLARQMERAVSVASELAEGPDTLSSKQTKRAALSLAGMATLLDKAARRGKLSSRRQTALAETLRARRKEFQKIIGD